MMDIFGDASADHVFMGQQNGFGLPCGARGKIEAAGITKPIGMLGGLEEDFLTNFPKDSA